MKKIIHCGLCLLMLSNFMEANAKKPKKHNNSYPQIQTVQSGNTNQTTSSQPQYTSTFKHNTNTGRHMPPKRQPPKIPPQVRATNAGAPAAYYGMNGNAQRPYSQETPNVTSPQQMNIGKSPVQSYQTTQISPQTKAIITSLSSVTSAYAEIFNEDSTTLFENIESKPQVATIICKFIKDVCTISDGEIQQSLIPALNNNGNLVDLVNAVCSLKNGSPLGSGTTSWIPYGVIAKVLTASMSTDDINTLFTPRSFYYTKDLENEVTDIESKHQYLQSIKQLSQAGLIASLQVDNSYQNQNLLSETMQYLNGVKELHLIGSLSDPFAIEADAITTLDGWTSIENLKLSNATLTEANPFFAFISNKHVSRLEWDNVTIADNTFRDFCKLFTESSIKEFEVKCGKDTQGIELWISHLPKQLKNLKVNLSGVSSAALREIAKKVLSCGSKIKTVSLDDELFNSDPMDEWLEQDKKDTELIKEHAAKCCPSLNSLQINGNTIFSRIGETEEALISNALSKKERKRLKREQKKAGKKGAIEGMEANTPALIADTPFTSDSDEQGIEESKEKVRVSMDAVEVEESPAQTTPNTPPLTEKEQKRIAKANKKLQKQEQKQKKTEKKKLKNSQPKGTTEGKKKSA